MFSNISEAFFFNVLHPKKFFGGKKKKSKFFSILNKYIICAKVAKVL
jgi:hypothetical protein